MNLKVLAEDNDNVLADVFVEFFDDNDHWRLKGRWSGYNINNKGYIQMPYADKMFHGDEIGEAFTKKHDKLTRKQMRIIWDHLQDEEFELEEHEDTI